MELITDRTREDVLLGTKKGFYGPEDLNRVERAVGELVEIAKALDVSLDGPIKTDWEDYFTIYNWSEAAEEMQRYIDNVHKLCDAVAAKVALPSTMNHLDYEGANQIEAGLLLAYERIQATLAVFRYSGELYSGDDFGI